MKYRALLELALFHSYYRDGRCPDLRSSQARDGAAAAKPSLPVQDHFLRDPYCDRRSWKQRPALVLLPAQTVLRFYLKLQRSDFALLTDLASLERDVGPTFSSTGLLQDRGGDLLLTRGGEARLPEGSSPKQSSRSMGTAQVRRHRSFALPFRPERALGYYCITDLAASEGELTVADANPGGPAEVLFGEGSRTTLEEAPDPADPIAVQFVGRYRA